MKENETAQGADRTEVLSDIFGKDFAEGLDFLRDEPQSEEPREEPVPEPSPILDSPAAEERPPEEPASAPELSDEALEEPLKLRTRRTAPKEEAAKLPWQKSFLSYLHDVVYFVSAILVIFLLLFRAVIVSGTSMNNTLYNGDYLILAGNLLYRNPKPGDIIVASKKNFENGTPIVKRVIATEGQEVDIDFATGTVYVDGKALEEDYILDRTCLAEGVTFPQKVEKGCLFVMGDNRMNSKDSRSPEIGQIDRREVLGKVLFLIFPGTNTRQDPRPFDLKRIGSV